VSGENHPVGPGLKEFAFGRRNLTASDDLDDGVHIACAQSDKDIGCIVRQHRGQHSGAGDPCLAQDSFIRGFPRQCEPAAFLGFGDALRRAIQNHERDFAGFKLAGRSEVNANPKDTADHPEGVWTLPPTYALKDKDRAKYQAIGESDRMTLKFVKP
jgi:hypothetical protein